MFFFYSFVLRDGNGTKEGGKQQEAGQQQQQQQENDSQKWFSSFIFIIVILLYLGLDSILISVKCDDVIVLIIQLHSK